MPLLVRDAAGVAQDTGLKAFAQQRQRVLAALLIGLQHNDLCRAGMLCQQNAHRSQRTCADKRHGPTHQGKLHHAVNGNAKGLHQRQLLPWQGRIVVDKGNLLGDGKALECLGGEPNAPAGGHRT